MKKYLKFNSGDHVRISNPKIKAFLQKATFQIGQKKCLRLKNLKMLCRVHMLLVILTVKKLLQCFTKKNCKKPIKKSLKLKM